MKTLNIATDFGASLGKAVYQGGSNEPSLILLKPEVISMPRTSIEAYQKSFSLGNTHPEETAWVKIKDEYFVLGELARHRFKVEANLNEPKYNKAICQCLAIIGSAIQREGEIPSSFNLATLLPFDEFRYKERFQEQVRSALESFTFRGKDYSLKLDKFVCLPEGSGLYLRGRQGNGLEKLANYKDITIAIVMMGYRNISLMIMDKGIPKVKETTFQGFAQMIELIKERVAVVNEPALIRAMSKPNLRQRKKALSQIAICNDLISKTREIEGLSEAIEDAKKEYLTVVTNFLNANLNSYAVNEFVVGGGTANYLKRELRRYFQSWGQTISWADNLEQSIKRNFGEKIERESLEYRLCDVYGLLYFLLNKPLPKMEVKNSYGYGKTSQFQTEVCTTP